MDMLEKAGGTVNDGAGANISLESVHIEYHRLAEKLECHAGIPLPASGGMTVHPRFKLAGVLERDIDYVEVDTKDAVTDDDQGTIRTWFWAARRQRRAMIIEDKEHPGKVKLRLGEQQASERLRMLLNTLAGSRLWTFEQEGRALEMLRGLITEGQLHTYQMMGCLTETSVRTGLLYLFRKLRPTLVFTPRDKHGLDTPEASSLIAGLCMHPIAHYNDSWAGALCPTDDVMAHLMLMRGDEQMLWKRCNQHAPDSNLLGL